MKIYFKPLILTTFSACLSASVVTPVDAKVCFLGLCRGGGAPLGGGRRQALFRPLLPPWAIDRRQILPAHLLGQAHPRGSCWRHLYEHCQKRHASQALFPARFAAFHRFVWRLSLLFGRGDGAEHEHRRTQGRQAHLGRAALPALLDPVARRVPHHLAL